ncbi:MAG: pantothenate kinase [Porphyromonadaceae bacterium CG2_30_38_12]|nr:MAG: pantothenate kinase [Porphyromonadaceae bacterium CG2_30_38_12]
MACAAKNNLHFNLCIDNGNSCAKVAVFQSDTIVFQQEYDALSVNNIRDILSQYTIKTCIYCNVGIVEVDLEFFLKTTFQCVIFLDEHTPIPITNNYLEPQRLGKDRLAAVVAASYLKKQTDILVIDAGTAITYDFIDAHAHYHGGNIAPGLALRFKSLHNYTQHLPLVHASESFDLLGNTTQQAILSGVMQGVLFEIEGYIVNLKIKYPQLSVFLTGGNAFYFLSRLKSPIFAQKNLVLIGLNRILQFNVKN